MISIDIRTKYNHLPQISAEIRPTVSQVVRKTAFDLEADVKKEMAKKKSGRTYRRGSFYDIKTRKALEYRTHVASAPGEAPAVDYGQLINSIQTQHETDLTSTVGTGVSYATPLEYGSRKMAPRPVWRPVADKLRPMFIEAITQLLQRLK